MIGHTQPRRLAARALANRLAHEMGTSVGAAVGYKVRFNDRTTRGTLVKLMTDGILLKELESDRSLRRYDTIIVDEAHERSLNIDLILGVLKQLLPKRPELRVIVTSATINPGQFSEFFGGAPIIEVSGRSYPVEVRYRPLIVAEEDKEEGEETAELSLPEGIVQAVRELDDSSRGIRGDTLVFLPGEKQIREAATALEKAELHNTEVLPLFSRLSTREQDRVFEQHGKRRVVLATNVAETSLTVPGIRFVVDSGLARISRYSVRAKVQRLPTERISRASAEQRKGRCGREAEGICIRLYSEEDYTLREEYTPPEVLRTNLASVILRMAVLGLGEPGRVSVPRSARYAPRERRRAPSAGTEGDGRGPQGHEPRRADRGHSGRPAPRPHAARRDSSRLPHRNAGDRGLPRSAGSARAPAGGAAARDPDAREVQRSEVGLRHGAQPLARLRRAIRGAQRQSAA